MSSLSLCLPIDATKNSSTRGEAGLDPAADLQQTAPRRLFVTTLAGPATGPASVLSNNEREGERGVERLEGGSCARACVDLCVFCLKGGC